MTVRVYRWDDASAPALSGAAGALTALLSACLVSGYGAKAAAGWTETTVSTNVKNYTNAGSGKSVKVSNNAVSSTARVVGCESSDGTTGPFFPTEAQLSGGLYWYVSSTADSTARPWVLVADNKRFYLWIGYSVATSTGLGTAAAMQTYFAGDITPNKGDDAFHFAVIGGASAGATASNFGTVLGLSTQTSTGQYLSRSYSQTGGSIAFGKLSDYGIQNSTTIGASYGITYPDPVSGGMILAPVRVTEASGNIRGVMPGLWAPQHVLPGNPGDTFTGVGPLAGKTMLLLDSMAAATRCRIALEISDTW